MEFPVTKRLRLAGLRPGGRPEAGSIYFPVSWLHKLVAYLTDNTVVAIVTVVSGLAAVAGVFTGSFTKAFQKIRAGVRRLIPLRRAQTLAFVQQKVLGHNSWSHGGVAGEDALQVSGEFLVTNITDPPRDIVLSDVRVVIPRARTGTKVHQPIPILAIRASPNLIPAGVTTKLTVIFFVTPRIRKPGEALAADLAVVDQFGTEHWLKSVRFDSSV